MNKKLISFIAMIVSAVIVLFGFLTLVGGMGGNTDTFGYYSNDNILYDSGYAEFGADFYTIVNNNVAEVAESAEAAASAARLVTRNQEKIANLLQNVCGVFLMGVGLLCLCHFTMIWLDEKKTLEAPVVVCDAAEEVPAQNAEA